MSDRTIIERAFELARGGDCRTLEELRRALTRERYAGVDAHLAGAGIRSQLKTMFRQQVSHPSATDQETCC
jgi:hypothetical protein